VVNHIPRKRFGQHFLSDRAMVEAIVDTIDPRPGQALVEIGPGLGAMTDPLVARSGKLTVIELDRDLAARLRKRPELEVVESDVLKVDFHALAATFGQKLRVVGNLPYNISTPILFHLLEVVDEVADQHFMLQKEVVDRMAAAPGSKDYGRLSVMLQWRYDIESVLDVPPECFDPPPRVDSAIVRMNPLPAPPGVDAALLGELVTTAFSQRRKVLRNTLGKWLDAKGFSGEVDLSRRAEEVPVAEYLALAAAVAALA
jgi:16S rRNA (adenine1518-N6/adenine1519-N6)-dimethyltransferase